MASRAPSTSESSLIRTQSIPCRGISELRCEHKPRNQSTRRYEYLRIRPSQARSHVEYSHFCISVCICSYLPVFAAWHVGSQRPAWGFPTFNRCCCFDRTQHPGRGPGFGHRRATTGSRLPSCWRSVVAPSATSSRTYPVVYYASWLGKRNAAWLRRN